ncbi:MAG: hypothetical protein FWD81_05460 [Methanomassiliicoccaceae archaeon]|nr:hypothetical protein [Methanomassiliicoccaceae archaeon]
MKLNRKGEGGFMESMLAVMVVVISLTAFLSFLPFSMSVEDYVDHDIRSDILDGVRISGGKIETEIGERIEETMIRYGYEGMTIILSVSDGIYGSEVTFSAGSRDSDNIVSKNGTITVRADDGRSVPVKYSMAVWL